MEELRLCKEMPRGHECHKGKNAQRDIQRYKIRLQHFTRNNKRKQFEHSGNTVADQHTHQLQTDNDRKDAIDQFKKCFCLTPVQIQQNRDTVKCVQKHTNNHCTGNNFLQKRNTRSPNPINPFVQSVHAEMIAERYNERMGKTVLLCLHGWGGSKESFTELREALKGSDIEILTPDLPGFGDEPEPSHPFTNDDYADWVVDWFTKKKSSILHPQSSILLLGHSHGGRIAIKLVAGHRLPVHHLLLCASAGIRHPRHFRRIAGLLLAKTGKFFLSIPGMRALQPFGKTLLYRLVRVHDYEKASPVMRDTLINVTEENLRPLLQAIDVPTDIFWGLDDQMTPVADGYLMAKKIPGSVLHTFRGVRHRVHRDRAEEIAKVLKKVSVSS